MGQLFLPDGAASGPPRPAVVILEGLGGVIPERELRYGAMLAREGYVALAVDTFRPRGVQPLSHSMRALRVTEAMMLADAYAALRWLADQPMVDPDRIAVMGFSYGAMVTVFSAYRQVQQVYAPDGLRFAAHASYYGCTVARFAEPTTTGAPVRIFLGGRDRNVCVDRSHLIAEDLRRGGSDVRIHLYPEAFHQWDSKDLTPRFTRWSLKNCAFVVEPDNRVRDPRTRLMMRGPVSRSLMIMANLDPRGYHMLRDEKILAKSDATLLDFYADALGRPSAAKAPMATPVRMHPRPAAAGARREPAMLRTEGSWK